MFVEVNNSNVFSYSLGTQKPFPIKSNACPCLPDDWNDRGRSYEHRGNCVLIYNRKDCGGKAEKFTFSNYGLNLKTINT